ncbi:MAG: SGNH/GDSL hydrolase family protein [Acidobacteriaceae bacterium]|nr:SGNH/GDSL hydrolase family protein [Acidobacteriaceae bacterium]
MKRIAVVFLALFTGLVASQPLYAQAAWLVGTWASSPVEYPAGNAGKYDLTLREIVHVSAGSPEFTAVTLSNEFGKEPLTIGAVTLAQRTTGSTVDATVPVTFEGKSSVVIPPGERVISDEVHFAFPAKSDLAVSIFVPKQEISHVSGHSLSSTTNFVALGDQTAAHELTDSKTMKPWLFLTEVGIDTATQSSILCFGDSITDGAHSTPDTNQRWPDLLYTRLSKEKRTSYFTVLNEGISGNRILRERAGPSAINRFDRDILNLDGPSSSGRRYVIFMEGINDIGHAYDPNPKVTAEQKRKDSVTAEELIAADRLLIARAHAHGLKIIGGTLTPYVGAKYQSAEGEKVREKLNEWIRTGGEFDGVVDFDKATQDPAHPLQFNPAYDSGDHLHPNDAGYQRMADAVDLALFK